MRVLEAFLWYSFFVRYKLSQVFSFNQRMHDDLPIGRSFVWPCFHSLLSCASHFEFSMGMTSFQSERHPSPPASSPPPHSSSRDSSQQSIMPTSTCVSNPFLLSPPDGDGQLSDAFLPLWAALLYSLAFSFSFLFLFFQLSSWPTLFSSRTTFTAFQLSQIILSACFCIQIQNQVMSPGAFVKPESNGSWPQMIVKESQSAKPWWITQARTIMSAPPTVASLWNGAII